MSEEITRRAFYAGVVALPVGASLAVAHNVSEKAAEPYPTAHLRTRRARGGFVLEQKWIVGDIEEWRPIPVA